MKQQVTKNNNNVDSLSELKSLVRSDLDKVNEIIIELAQSKVELIPEISNHTISSGGKRLRPMLTLASAQLCGYEGEHHVALAASVEFIHTATLLHDDVVDDSDYRRGNKTASNVWGNKECILVGDFLLAKAFQLMGEAKSLEVYKILSDASAVISEGEVLQLTGSDNISEAYDYYLQVISTKTAELFAASCQISGVVAGVDESKVQALRNYGMNLGIAFQIVDDALDYSSKQEQMGKSVGDDFREGKVTLPVIEAFKAAEDDEERDFWNRVMIDKDIADADLEVAIGYIYKHNAIEKSIEVAREYIEKAVSDLNVFGGGKIKEVLVDIAEFVADREY